LRISAKTGTWRLRSMHLGAFMTAKDAFIKAPYPAWSCIGTTELITEGALVEVRVICQRK
jgi:hypothetical protein